MIAQPTHRIRATFGKQGFWIIVKEWRSRGKEEFWSVVREWRARRDLAEGEYAPGILPFGKYISLETGFDAQAVGSVLRWEGRRWDGMGECAPEGISPSASAPMALTTTLGLEDGSDYLGKA